MTTLTETWREAAEALRPRAQAFIGGAFVPAASGATFADTSPRDGRVVADVARGGPEDVDRAVAAARAPPSRSAPGARPRRASAGRSCCAWPT